MSMHRYKRQRGKNFTKWEELQLLQLMQANNHVTNNSTTITGKRKSWEDVAQQFSKQTGMQRSWTALRDKYKSMSTKLKLCKRQSLQTAQPEQQKLFLNEVKTAETTPIKAEVFEILEFKEQYVQNYLATSNETPNTKSTENLVPKYLKENRTQQNIINKRTLLEEKKRLLQLQQKFYQNEHLRAAQRHNMKLISLKLKKELIMLQLEIKRMHIEEQQAFIKSENLSS